MKNADFMTLLAKLPTSKARWLYDNYSGYYVTIHTADKAYGIEYDALTRLLRVNVSCKVTGETLNSACHKLTDSQADRVASLYKGV